MKCKVCGTNEVIYSGVDAFMLGVPTEKVCYSCAGIYASVKELNSEELRDCTECADQHPMNEMTQSVILTCNACEREGL